MITDEELDSRLGLADPARLVRADEAALAELLSDVRRRVPPAAPWYRRHRALAGLGVAGAVLVGGALAAPAAADVIRQFFAQSDWRPAAGGEILPDSDWIDFSAPDVNAYVESLYPEWLPLPPDTDRAAFIDTVLDNMPATGLMQEIGVENTYEWRAQCAWLDEWEGALGAGELDRVEAAAAVLQESASWPGIVATDGGGIADDARKAAGFAKAGDVAGVRSTGLWLNCFGDVRGGE